jgi:hypothetical protein
MHTTLLNDESGPSETSVATWTNIIVLLRFQLQVNLDEVFFFFFAIILRARPFPMIEETTQHFMSPGSVFLTESKTTN